ncbi:transcription activator of gluconeogenesis [Lentithecium fluviatile CBS 122367]|uniref:Transcription activator of gluconeogenesis n=1 Tax=Lentithecium fluviatile CBS 122367 TaxID=1168545 RepID=A0A6G1IPA5_9PLEO|nr:transcription activator of gluconeogenesis [Lentithecium fluviatile CBS 122367]
MSTPEPEDASPSPDYSGAEDDDNDMSVEQRNGQSGGDVSTDQKTSTKPASNAKDPSRPRRKKARRACFACQRAHLTCGDERPCGRCVKRGLQDSCMDGLRKKAKYLHDAPDGALMPGVGGHYPHMNGNRPVPLPSQEQGPVPVGQQSYYTEAPSATYYAPHASGQMQSAQNPAFNHPQPPISPPYTQPMQTPIATAPPASQGQSAHIHQQFGGPLFDPSDPALFNFDISSLNFGNHYGALELGMLGHMSSAVGEVHADENPLNQAAGLFNPQMPPGSYGETHGLPAHISFGPDGRAHADWQNAHSRHGSMQVQTPNNTPNMGNIDNLAHRHDSIGGPPAYAIGQGPSSLSSASPASTDVNSGYDNENPMSAATFFANAQQSHPQRSPTTGRRQPENHSSNGPLQPVHTNAVRKRHQGARPSIYASVTKPHNYNSSFHRLYEFLLTKYAPVHLNKALKALHKFRPVLLTNAGHLDDEDLIYQEKNLQRSLVTMLQNFAEVGTPSLICRRSGEVVGMNKEFEILTGWKREILLGHAPNANVNRGDQTDRGSVQNQRTPTLPGQEPDPGPHAVNLLELMDQASGVQYLDDFSDLCFEDPLGKGHRRVNMLRYLTKEDMARIQDRANALANGKPVKPEPTIKHEDASIHQGEAAMRNLGANGLIDAMIMWHIKRDNFDMPMLVAMQIMPMLKP